MGRRSPRARRAALFDAAGTLIELREPVGETYARVAREQGVAASAWRLSEAFARVWRSTPPMVFPGLDPPAARERERAAWRTVVHQTFRAADSAAVPPDEERAFEVLFAHFGRGDAWRARPGAHRALSELRAAGIATAVVSNFDQRLRAILSDLALAKGLDRIWLASDAGVAKPDPAIFLSALAALGIAPERALYVGDDPEVDIAGARAAGLSALHVASLATLADLPAWLERALPEEPPQ